MTHKDFIAIAGILAKHRMPGKLGHIYYAPEIECRLADYLASTNPAFDRDRFLQACRIGGA
jgi:hypothetical protein